MRIITEQSENRVASVVAAVRKDPESWNEWSCLRLEILAFGQLIPWAGLHGSIRHLVVMCLQDRQGTAYMSGLDEIDIFCKGVSHSLLDMLGRQIVDLVRGSAGIAALYRVYDLTRDAEGFLQSYDRRIHERAAALPAPSMQPDLPFLLPEDQGARGDGLSRMQGRKVLLVEDDPITRWMVKMALKNECRLTVVPDANKAMAAYHGNRPDMVLLDINLPGKNGYDVMEHIIHADPGAHIVMFSAQDSLENMVDTLESGAMAFIAKPFNRERLVQCVQNCPSAR